MLLKKQLIMALSTMLFATSFFNDFREFQVSASRYDDDNYGYYYEEEEEDEFEPDDEDYGAHDWVVPKKASKKSKEVDEYLSNLSYYKHRNGPLRVAGKRYGGTQDRFNMSQQTRELMKQIIAGGTYKLGKRTITVPTSRSCRAVQLLTPKDYGNCKEKIGKHASLKKPLNNCVFENLDSFSAAHKYHSQGPVLVMNFANAYKPGGGFLNGADAQEESLCIWSTLYASLINSDASTYYKYNRQCRNKKGDPNAYGTIDMLLSPTVIVLRNPDGTLRNDPFVVSVISLAAPNLKAEAKGVKQKSINKTVTDQLRNMFRVAAAKGYKTLILGAYGCGAFGHDAKNIATSLRVVLHDEGYGRLFDKIVFAIPGNGKGKWMRRIFQSIIVEGKTKENLEGYNKRKRKRKFGDTNFGDRKGHADEHDKRRGRGGGVQGRGDGRGRGGSH